MRVISFQRNSGGNGIGVMTDDSHFIDASKRDAGLPVMLRALLALPDGLARLRKACAGQTADLSFAQVTLLPLIPDPHALWALALNFRTHIEETGLVTSKDYPQVFLRTAASQVAHLAPLKAPPFEIGSAFDYEGELAVIIGRGGRHIPVDKALDHVAGYSCYNEGSVRNFQEHNRQFGLGKNFEASGSFGPWLMTPDEFGKPQDHTVSTRLNGVTRQHAPISDLLFSVEKIIHYLSTGYNLRPGDVIITGTPGALPPQPGDTESVPEKQYGRFKVPGLAHMRAGGTVEVEISGLGVLRNPIVADEPVAYRPGN
jgi:2-keto-4-pentenoate hydratase/2-oxohepta-3-ene-1,7-dioic acid hydratase in catechol pathway